MSGSSFVLTILALLISLEFSVLLVLAEDYEAIGADKRKNFNFVGPMEDSKSRKSCFSIAYDASKRQMCLVDSKVTGKNDTPIRACNYFGFKNVCGIRDAIFSKDCHHPVKASLLAPYFGYLTPSFKQLCESKLPVLSKSRNVSKIWCCQEKERCVKKGDMCFYKRNYKSSSGTTTAIINRQTAVILCNKKGFKRLCSSDEVQGWNICKPGYMADFLGHYSDGSCGDRGFHHYRETSAGAYCCQREECFHFYYSNGKKICFMPGIPIRQSSAAHKKIADMLKGSFMPFTQVSQAEEACRKNGYKGMCKNYSANWIGCYFITSGHHRLFIHKSTRDKFCQRGKGFGFHYEDKKRITAGTHCCEENLPSEAFRSSIVLSDNNVAQNGRCIFQKIIDGVWDDDIRQCKEFLRGGYGVVIKLKRSVHVGSIHILIGKTFKGLKIETSINSRKWVHCAKSDQIFMWKNIERLECESPRTAAYIKISGTIEGFTLCEVAVYPAKQRDPYLTLLSPKSSSIMDNKTENNASNILTDNNKSLKTEKKKDSWLDVSFGEKRTVRTIMLSSLQPLGNFTIFVYDDINEVPSPKDLWNTQTICKSSKSDIVGRAFTINCTSPIIGKYLRLQSHSPDGLSINYIRALKIFQRIPLGKQGIFGKLPSGTKWSNRCTSIKIVGDKIVEYFQNEAIVESVRIKLRPSDNQGYMHFHISIDQERCCTVQNELLNTLSWTDIKCNKALKGKSISIYLISRGDLKVCGIEAWGEVSAIKRNKITTTTTTTTTPTTTTTTTATTTTTTTTTVFAHYSISEFAMSPNETPEKSSNNNFAIAAGGIGIIVSLVVIYVARKWKNSSEEIEPDDLEDYDATYETYPYFSNYNISHS